jgi:hypothetical protein
MSTVTFTEKTKPLKGNKRAATYLACAVDGCETEVKTKERWVGVFL